MKKCFRCQLLLPVDAFHRNRSTHDGLSAQCKACRKTNPGHSKQPRDRTRQSWEAMMLRCFSPSQKSFDRYGGRGIEVCERWRSYDAFRADMGERPRDMTLDRIDGDRGYEPGNCRWATPATQMKHTVRNRVNTVAVCLIRSLARRGWSHVAIGRAFGLDRKYVGRIVRRQIWRTAFDEAVPAG